MNNYIEHHSFDVDGTLLHFPSVETNEFSQESMQVPMNIYALLHTLKTLDILPSTLDQDSLKGFPTGTLEDEYCHFIGKSVYNQFEQILIQELAKFKHSKDYHSKITTIRGSQEYFNALSKGKNVFTTFVTNNTAKTIHNSVGWNNRQKSTLKKIESFLQSAIGNKSTAPDFELTPIISCFDNNICKPNFEGWFVSYGQMILKVGKDSQYDVEKTYSKLVDPRSHNIYYGDQVTKDGIMVNNVNELMSGAQSISKEQIKTIFKVLNPNQNERKFLLKVWKKFNHTQDKIKLDYIHIGDQDCPIVKELTPEALVIENFHDPKFEVQFKSKTRPSIISQIKGFRRSFNV